MKYIKKYENEIVNPYKKYAVWKNVSSNKFIIVAVLGVEVDSTYGDRFKIQTLYNYDSIKNTFEKIQNKKNKFIFYKNHVNSHIYFSFDTIEECKQQIELLNASNKYNL